MGSHVPPLLAQVRTLPFLFFPDSLPLLVWNYCHMLGSPISTPSTRFSSEAQRCWVTNFYLLPRWQNRQTTSVRIDTHTTDSRLSEKPGLHFKDLIFKKRWNVIKCDILNFIVLKWILKFYQMQSPFKSQNDHGKWFRRGVRSSAFRENNRCKKRHYHPADTCWRPASFATLRRDADFTNSPRQRQHSCWSPALSLYFERN